MNRHKKKKNKLHQYISDKIKYIRKNIKEWLKNNRQHIDSKIESTKFIWDFFQNYFKSKLANKRGFLLMPPTELDGSFGDELMVISFVNKFKNYPVTLYESKVNIREDLFENYQNVRYLKWGDSLLDHSFLDGVFILGADNMTPNYGFEDQFFKCNVLRIGNKFKLRTGILAFSLNKSIFGSQHVKWFRDLLPKTLFTLREEDSFSIAKQILPISNLHSVADLAFLCPYTKNSDVNFQKWIDKQKLDKKTIVGFCPNSIQANKIGVVAYKSKMLLALKKMIENYDIAVALLYHDIRYQVNDRTLAEDLYIELKSNNKDVFFNNNIKNGLELKSYLEFVDFTFTGRMHFGISGYSLGKPMLGIAYEDKFSGLQKLFSIDVESSLVDYNELEKAEYIIAQFMSKLPEFKNNVKENLPKVLELSAKTFELIK